ncbi:death-associated inhibitor of apoptosis 1-like [Anopheles cruzii]|uniref:death-associated inhibitor of apoptosis 1-like n=1 Tax=Anopheles cruzii TaxID=68878 RepID=UPI0022EC38D0|nr:death-associated inhibitor of apoptosis 1-like [Anopheles cruzii]
MTGRLHEDLNREICRLGTFTSSWPVSFINPSELARYGFFYTGIADRVKCYFCEVEVGMWEEQDNVITEHLRWSPRCPLLRKRTTNNVPINPNFLDNVPDPDGDVCGSNMHRFNNSMTSVQHNNYTEDSQRSFQRLAHPSYAIEANRLSSFKSWPKSIHQKPQQLSDAGFFYTGFGDRVECFSCGGGLNDWEPEDEPWEQHAKHHSTCEYVKLVKGRDFVETCKRIASNTEPGTSSLRLPTEPTSHWTPSGDAECSPTLEGDRQDDEKVTKDEKLCKICLLNEYNTVFLPCGHVVACGKCAQAVTECPLCRDRYIDIRRVYLA